MDINYQGSGGGIPRKTAKIFASNAEKNRITVFGSTLAGDTEYTTDIADVQNGEFESGWDSAVISNKNYPLLTDMNGVQKTTSQQIAYILQHGLAEYDANTTYYTYDICNVGGIIYISLKDANKGHNPTSSSTYWSVYYDPSTLSKGLITGQTIFSLDPLIDAGLHLLDGSVLTVGGAYDDFITTYVIPLYTAHPERFKTEQQWQQIATEYGACGYYVYNQGVSVRLPKVTGHVEGTLDPNALGDVLRAGLPTIPAHTHTYSGTTGNQNANHTHSRGTMNITGTFNGRSLTDGGNTGTGAFAGGGAGSLTTPDTGGDESQDGFNFDASRSWTGSTSVQSASHGHAYSGTTSSAGGQSSGIYGRSDTVQTQSILGYYYIVVANSTKTEIEVDIDEIATDLNNKADKDLSNVSSISASSAVQTALNDKVSKSGDTMTGNLNIQKSSNPNVSLINTDFDYTTTTAPASTITIGDFYIREKNNKCTSYLTNYFTTTNTMVTRLVARRSISGAEKTATFDLIVDSTGKPSAKINNTDVVALSMPSSRYIDLTLGASGTTYTAPANGYFSIAWWTTSVSTSYLHMSSGSMGILMVPNQGSPYQIKAFLPVKKEDVMTLAYGNLEDVSGSHGKFFRFVYAEGDN